MAQIQFGWSMPSGVRDKSQQGIYVSRLQEGLELVAGHFDSAWFVDHFQYEDAMLMEGWTALTYLSALQPQLKFGHAVLSQSFRNPALLAKMAATLQFMSGGRFILGIGAGWKEDEYRAYGYDFPAASIRIEELEETLQIIKALWREERATVKGKHYRVNEAWCEPKPEAVPPIMVGGSKPRMLRLIAKYADWWNVSWTAIEDYRKQVVECERACAEVQRDPATLRRTWFGGCLCAPTEAEVEQLNKEMNLSAGKAFVGTPAQILEQMQPFLDLGVNYFMLSSGGFPDLTTLDTLVHEVLPVLNH
ncbi:MAG TPA: LLM class flavin-dependent oxidoreductase [Ktedonobacteraceae bacterium]|nr:LLM class flavin-dependent oxidoreductase [Ktedonobacteraceae bacterium]